MSKAYYVRIKLTKSMLVSVKADDVLQAQTKAQDLAWGKTKSNQDCYTVGNNIFDAKMTVTGPYDVKEKP